MTISPYRVLVIDDDRALLDSIVRSARSQTLAVDVAQDPARAVELAREQQYDAIAVDYMLESSSGLDVIDTLRALRPATPFLLMSGVLDAHELGRLATHHGFSGALRKPWRDLPGALSACIERYAHHYEASVYAPVIETLENLQTPVLSLAPQRAHWLRGAALHEQLFMPTQAAVAQALTTLRALAQRLGGHPPAAKDGGTETSSDGQVHFVGGDSWLEVLTRLTTLSARHLSSQHARLQALHHRDHAEALDQCAWAQLRLEHTLFNLLALFRRQPLRVFEGTEGRVRRGRWTRLHYRRLCEVLRVAPAAPPRELTQALGRVALGMAQLLAEIDVLDIDGVERRRFTTLHDRILTFLREPSAAGGIELREHVLATLEDLAQMPGRTALALRDRTDMERLGKCARPRLSPQAQDILLGDLSELRGLHPWLDGLVERIDREQLSDATILAIGKLVEIHLGRLPPAAWP